MSRVWERFSQSAALSAVALLAVAPHIYYLGAVAHTERLLARYPGLTLEEIFKFDLMKVGILIVISSLVGFFFSQRNGLPGLGSLRSALKPWWLLAAAPVLGAFLYLTVGRAIAQRMPGLYPVSVFWALVVLLKGAVFDELVARFGMMTLVSGVTRRPWIAILLQAVFFTAIAVKDLGIWGVSGASALFWASIATTFVVHLVYGGLYARRGLLCAMFFHGLVDLRFVAHALFS